jgi:hypothetical protein
MIDQDIKKFVLRRLLQKNGEPATATELKLAIRSAFNAALTEGELDSYLTQLADDNFVTVGKDDFGSAMLDLTPKGRNTAARLVKLA